MGHRSSLVLSSKFSLGFREETLGGRLWFGCDGNRNVSTLFKPHIIAMFVR
jgi:hypothetical protein